MVSVWRSAGDGKLRGLASELKYIFNSGYRMNIFKCIYKCALSSYNISTPVLKSAGFPENYVLNYLIKGCFSYREALIKCLKLNFSSGEALIKCLKPVPGKSEGLIKCLNLPLPKSRGLIKCLTYVSRFCSIADKYRIIKRLFIPAGKYAGFQGILHKQINQ